jgi:hypothetical protein
MKSSRLGMAAMALMLSSGCLADDLKAEQKFSESSVGFDLNGSYSNVTLTIAGPNDFHASAFSANAAPTIDLRRFGSLEDGTYTYQLTAATPEKAKVRTRLDDGRDSHMAKEPQKSVATSGAFRVKDGAIVKSAPASTTSKRDQQ